MSDQPNLYSCFSSVSSVDVFTESNSACGICGQKKKKVVAFTRNVLTLIFSKYIYIYLFILRKNVDSFLFGFIVEWSAHSVVICNTKVILTVF